MKVFASLPVLLAGVALSAAGAQDSPQATAPAPPSSNGLAIHTKVAQQLQPYLDCVLSVSNARAREMPAHPESEDGTYPSCEGIRQSAKAAAIAKLGPANSTQNEAYVDKILNQIESYFVDIDRANRASFKYAVNNAVKAGAYDVPDGMWEYHVCRSLKSGDAVYLNGKTVQPRFPNDPNCDLAREYSRREALSYLNKAGQPKSREARAAMVQKYFDAIDEHAARKTHS